MRPAHVIEIVTPKKFVLNGLWFGPKKAKKVIIWVHGLGSSAFSRLDIIERLVDRKTAVMTFNNRGHDTVARIRKVAKKNSKAKPLLGGAAHEVFTESADDLEGAVRLAKGRGAKEIYLAGHSTGCQKSVYYATRKGNARKIKGIILLAPVSDFASNLHLNARDVRLQVREARKLIRKGKRHGQVPGTWADAQRVISLNTPDSAEEIFSYISPKRKPKTYHALTTPALVLFAEKDEYADRPADKMAGWFKDESRAKKYEARIIKGAEHSFKGDESKVARFIRRWILAL